MDISQLFCIDLDLPDIEGFRKFISSWLYQDEHFTILVDPGPLSTISHLCSELHRRGVTHIDHVLLTHIHIDHAGGTGALLKEFPAASVICHPDGIRHMVAPEKLWEGSRKVLGPLAEAYGEIVPVPADRIRHEETIGTTGIMAHLTPGHAQHHCSYLLDDLLFAGEVAGVRCEVPDGIFMRPATPPRFMLPIALDSIDRMIRIAPRVMVFAHYGLVENGLEHLKIARHQLLLWVRGVAAITVEETKKRQQALIEWLLEHDQYYRRVNSLPDDIKVRELYFLGNTLRGMMEYVDNLADDERQVLALAAQDSCLV